MNLLGYSVLHWGLNKMAIFCRWYFETHFNTWGLKKMADVLQKSFFKCIFLIKKSVLNKLSLRNVPDGLTENISIGSGNDYMPTRHQIITWFQYHQGPHGWQWYFYTPHFNQVKRDTLISRVSVCGWNHVHSVSSTVLAGSISYLYILSNNFRRCVACQVFFKFFFKFPKFEFWQIFKMCKFHFVLFWLGIQNESKVWVILGPRGYSHNAGILVALV